MSRKRPTDGTSRKPPADDLEELEARVEAVEAQLDEQSTRLRLLWGVLLAGVSSVVILAAFPSSVVISLGLLAAAILILARVR